MRYLTALCLSTLLILTQVMPSYACSPSFSHNYWYLLDYEISTESLPVGVEAILGHPPYDEELESAMWPHIEFINKSDGPIYIMPSTFDERASQTTIKVNATRTHKIPSNLLRVINPQSPGGADPPPPPYLYEMKIFQKGELFIVPITIKFSPNPDYDETDIPYGASMSDHLILSDFVVIGEVIGAAADSRVRMDGKPQVIGYARVRVEQWLLGDGPEEIEIGYFSESPGSDCGMGMWKSDRAYFLLKSPENSTSSRYSLTSDFEDAPTVLAVTEENTELIELALKEVKGVTVDLAVTIEPTAEAVTKIESTPTTEPETEVQAATVTIEPTTEAVSTKIQSPTPTATTRKIESTKTQSPITPTPTPTTETTETEREAIEARSRRTSSQFLPYALIISILAVCVAVVWRARAPRA